MLQRNQRLAETLNRLNRCRTNRMAVFEPIPGNFANSFTAFSNNTEGYC